MTPKKPQNVVGLPCPAPARRPDRALSQTGPGLLTVEELASLLKVSTKTVYRMVDRREIAFFKVGHALRFSQGAVEQWLESRMYGPITK